MRTIDDERARRLAWLALGLYIVGLGISAILRKQGDFNVYYRAGHRVLHGLAIYPPDDSDRFLYAPIFAIAFAPLAAMPRRLAQLVFFTINAFALVEFVLGAGVILFGRARRLPAALIVLPVLLAFVFIDNNIEHGQINLLTLALIVWAIVGAEESRNASAGAMLAAAILIKPFAVLAALFLLARSRFAALGWSIVAGIALLVAPIVFFGLHRWIDQNAAYLTAMVSMTNRYRTMITNQSAVSAVARLMSLRIGMDAEASSIPTVVGMGVEMILVVAVILWDSIGREPASSGTSLRGRLALCGLFCLMPSFAPISWKSYYAAMLVPYMALVAALWTDRADGENAQRVVWTLFGLSIALNYVPELHWNRFALFYSAHFVSSILTLAALYLLWLRSGSTNRTTATMNPATERDFASEPRN